MLGSELSFFLIFGISCYLNQLEALFYNIPSSVLFIARTVLQPVKYRSRTDITREILEAASNGTSKTKIMYAAYLSFAQLKEYLAALSDNGLLEYDSERTEYRTTAKGKQFLQVYDDMTLLTGDLKQTDKAFSM